MSVENILFKFDFDRNGLVELCAACQNEMPKELAESLDDTTPRSSADQARPSTDSAPPTGLFKRLFTRRSTDQATSSSQPSPTAQDVEEWAASLELLLNADLGCLHYRQRAPPPWEWKTGSKLSDQEPRSTLVPIGDVHSIDITRIAIPNTDPERAVFHVGIHIHTTSDSNSGGGGGGGATTTTSGGGGGRQTQLHLVGVRNPRGLYARVMNLRHKVLQERAASNRIQLLKMEDHVGADQGEYEPVAYSRATRSIDLTHVPGRGNTPPPQPPPPVNTNVGSQDEEHIVSPIEAPQPIGRGTRSIDLSRAPSHLTTTSSRASQERRSVELMNRDHEEFQGGVFSYSYEQYEVGRHAILVDMDAALDAPSNAIIEPLDATERTSGSSTGKAVPTSGASFTLLRRGGAETGQAEEATRGGGGGGGAESGGEYSLPGSLAVKINNNTNSGRSSSGSGEGTPGKTAAEGGAWVPGSNAGGSGLPLVFARRSVDGNMRRSMDKSRFSKEPAESTRASVELREADRPTRFAVEAGATAEAAAAQKVDITQSDFF